MKQYLLDFPITLGRYQEIVDRLIALSGRNESSYTCVANVHMLVEAHNDQSFASVVGNADFVTPDGMPLVFGLKLLYGIKQDRVAGMDLLPDLLKQAETNQLSLFFYGGTDEMLKATESYIRDHFPLLTNIHMYSPPFRRLSEEEDAEIVEKINASGAHLVFVALGCPKQEKWMASMKGRINACMIGIGGALPVMVGLQKRSPVWMQKASLEWLYRLMQEPRRLFRRYFVTNTIFIGLLFKAWLKQGFRKVAPLDSNTTKVITR